MYEVELKVRAAHGPVRERIEAVDGDHAGTVRQVDTYFDAPHRDFAATDEALRLRVESDPKPDADPDAAPGAAADKDAAPDSGARTVFLTYKGPLVDSESKTREEAETAVADPDAIRDVLDGLGFEPAATVCKRRERYDLAGYTVTLDTVDGLGEFVEVETETEDDVETARDGARNLLERLELDPTEGIRTSYLGLLLAEGDVQ